MPCFCLYGFFGKTLELHVTFHKKSPFAKDHAVCRFVNWPGFVHPVRTNKSQCLPVDVEAKEVEFIVKMRYLLAEPAH